jgi:hypothetical protein
MTTDPTESIVGNAAGLAPLVRAILKPKPAPVTKTWTTPNGNIRKSSTPPPLFPKAPRTAGKSERHPDDLPDPRKPDAKLARPKGPKPQDAAKIPALVAKWSKGRK